MVLRQQMAVGAAETRSLSMTNDAKMRFAQRCTLATLGAVVLVVVGVTTYPLTSARIVGSVLMVVALGGCALEVLCSVYLQGTQERLELESSSTRRRDRSWRLFAYVAALLLGVVLSLVASLISRVSG